MNRTVKKIGKVAIPVLTVSASVLGAIAAVKKKDSIYGNSPDELNSFEGKQVEFVTDENDKENADGERGHLIAIGDSEPNERVYEKYGKRAIDIVLSFGGLVALSPFFLVTALAIKIDDPGPVFFTQKRVGKNKQFFKLHKFRSMKMSTPHDVPTHMLDNPDQYITRVGKFLRAHSLDELPQIWDIFIGNMSVIGPRPALWNQDVLTAERDKYGANDIKPGLTGWAQINGRDELELAEKAKMDGEYVSNESLGVDIKCFIRTIKRIGKDDSVVEGGTGELQKKLRRGVPEIDPTPVFGCDKIITIDEETEKKILITGANSYVGESFREYAAEHYPLLHIDVVDMIGDEWRTVDFSKYDTVYHVAGIAHADIGNVDEETREKYYKVNTDLAIEVANKAKAEGVNQFVFMSSMIIYGESAPYGKEKMITKEAIPSPANFYGDSKWQADKGVRALESDTFHVAVLRPPMIYGRGSKGNYPTLAKIARKLPVFPNVENKRSMLHIDNLSEFLCKLIMSGEGGVFFPQNEEYTKTSEMVKMIGEVTYSPVKMSRMLNPAVRIGVHVPGKVNGLVNKAFGNSCYDQKLSQYSFEYRVRSLKESITATEGADNSKQDDRKHILLISQYFYPETFRVNDMACEWVKRGYKVTVLTGIPNYPMGKYYEGYDKKHRRRENWNGVNIIRIPLIARGNSSNKILNAGGMSANYLSFVKSGRKWVKSKEAAMLNADIVFTFEVSPMTQALIGIWYGKRYNVPTYLYVQDLWPENVETVTGIHNKAIIGPIEKMVDKIYRETAIIFTTSPSFVDAIVNRNNNVDKSKVHYWPQYAEDFYKVLPKQQVEEIDPEDNSFKIAFTGNIGTAQGLDVLPKTAELLKNENVKFVIVGDGRYQAEFERQIAERDVKDKFIMIPRVPAENVPKILSSCDAGFISFNNTSLWEMTIPAKLQSYMACGKAIVASAAGETKRIIEEAECGICTKIGDARALAEGINRLREDDYIKLGENAREYFENNFEKQMLMDEMDEFFGRENEKMGNSVIKNKARRPYQICNCCVMDTTDDDIVFDENGVCERCNEYSNRILPEWNHGKGHEQELEALIKQIKESGKNKKYDCILGLSGGLDSSYMLHLAVKEWGLRPFVFHIDAGWNLPVAEENIKRLTDKLGVKLHVEKMDWTEMREMQLAWFRTGLEMLDAPQDHAFIALIDKYSQELGVKYILNGYNICTEIVADPASWEKGAGPTGDGTYMKDVVKKHCRIQIKKYTYTSGLKHKFIIPYIKGVKTVKPLNLVEFTRASMTKTLEDEYGYVPYGQKHFEDLITKFLEGWWQPTRFGHDIRRAQLSSLVVTGQMSRDEALKILEQPPLTEEESKELFSEVARKLQISEEELMKFHEMPECKERFKSQENFYNLGIKVYEKLGLEKRIRK